MGHIYIYKIFIMINKLSLDDINKEFVDNISFVFISCAGSLGPDGKMAFILKNGKTYQCNIAYPEAENYVNPFFLRRILSVEYDFEIDENYKVNGFESIYLGGYGNMLYVKPEYALDFYRFAYGLQPHKVFE